MPLDYKWMEAGLYRTTPPVRRSFRTGLIGLAAIGASPLAGQDNTAAADAPPNEPASPPPSELTFDLNASMPRENSSLLRLTECQDRNDAGTISGEIVVCRKVGSADAAMTGTREQTQRRFAQETMLRGAPRAPDFIIDCHEQGYPFGCVAFGKAPQPAYVVDFGALPMAPAGSDADRMARGLRPMSQGGELPENEECARSCDQRPGAVQNKETVDRCGNPFTRCAEP